MTSNALIASTALVPPALIWIGAFVAVALALAAIFAFARRRGEA